MKSNQSQLKRRIRNQLIFFIVALLLSGLTAFPIETELQLVSANFSQAPQQLKEWIHTVYLAVRNTNDHYPYLSYGTDWLAFAHIVIAVAFIGPLKDPVRNIWVIQFGMIACAMVFPLAFIAGGVRGIPFFWQLIDCSFGVVGFVVLYKCFRDILTLEKMIPGSVSREGY